jgi:hypothetical protein
MPPSSGLKMGGSMFLRTLLSTYKSTRRYKPEDVHRHLNRRQNLKFHNFIMSVNSNNHMKTTKKCIIKLQHEVQQEKLSRAQPIETGTTNHHLVCLSVCTGLVKTKIAMQRSRRTYSIITISYVHEEKQPKTSLST